MISALGAQFKIEIRAATRNQIVSVRSFVAPRLWRRVTAKSGDKLRSHSQCTGGSSGGNNNRSTGECAAGAAVATFGQAPQLGADRQTSQTPRCPSVRPFVRVCGPRRRKRPAPAQRATNRRRMIDGRLSSAPSGRPRDSPADDSTRFWRPTSCPPEKWPVIGARRRLFNPKTAFAFGLRRITDSNNNTRFGGQRWRPDENNPNHQSLSSRPICFCWPREMFCGAALYREYWPAQVCRSDGRTDGLNFAFRVHWSRQREREKKNKLG